MLFDITFNYLFQSKQKKKRRTKHSHIPLQVVKYKEIQDQQIKQKVQRTPTETIFKSFTN